MSVAGRGDCLKMQNEFKPLNNKPIEEFEDYEGFVEKFKPKLTTDDCYTPPAVYTAVLEWVKDEIGITEGMEVIRPFYPGGDYENEDYMGKVVIDNPPFSIISRIVRFYQEQGIPFFLFAPRMTCLSGKAADMQNLTAVFGAHTIVYENGAKVPTAFLTNMAGDLKIWVSETLREKIKAVQGPSGKQLPKYVYPDNVVKTADMEQYGNLKIHRRHILPVNALDAQRKHGKTVFGKGFMLSASAAKAAKAAKADHAIVWELSEREKELLRRHEQAAADIRHDGTHKAV